jgi:hypothetical protein
MSVCSDLLKFGVFDQQSFKGDSQKTQWMLRKIASRQFATEHEFDDFALSLGLPVDDIPISIGGSSKKNSFKQWFANFCDLETQSASESVSVVQWTSKASDTIVKSFLQCVSSPGLQVWLEETLDPFTFRLRAKFVPNAPAQKPVKVTFGFQPPLAAAAPVSIGDLTRGYTIYPSTNLDTLCTRSSTAAIAVAANAGGPGGYALTLGNMNLPAIAPADILLFAATSVNRKNTMVATDCAPLSGYGAALIDAYTAQHGILSPVLSGDERSAEWVISPVVAGQYEVLASYNNDGTRLLDLYVDNQQNPKLSGMLRAPVSKTWQPQETLWDISQGEIDLEDGAAHIRIVGPSVRAFPHLHRLRLRWLGALG